MIESFKHKGLERFFSNSSCRGIPGAFASRIERMLDRLDASSKPEDMNLPGYKFHRLKGIRKSSYSITVSGNWRITFEFDGEHVVNVDLEDYH